MRGPENESSFLVRSHNMQYSRIDGVMARYSSLISTSLTPVICLAIPSLKVVVSRLTKTDIAIVWIDTCCINKSNSSELSDAINSMFMWYKKAQICYAYLYDVSRCDTLIAEFSNSQWFRRGWTLQELVAPNNVVFFSRDWQEIGSKSSFARLIEQITEIDRGVLLTNYQEEVSVAKKVSWATGRQTMRVEDRAYSLLGLFGYTCPRYTEREKMHSSDFRSR